MSKGSSQSTSKHQAERKGLFARPTLDLQPAPVLREESGAFLTSSPFIRRASANSSKIETRSLGHTEGPRNFLPPSIFRVGNFMVIFSVSMAAR